MVRPEEARPRFVRPVRVSVGHVIGYRIVMERPAPISEHGARRVMAGEVDERESQRPSEAGGKRKSVRPRKPQGAFRRARRAR